MRLLTVVLLILTMPVAAAAEPLAVPRATAPVRVDGVLDDAAWRGAARIDTFYEFSPGDNVSPKVRTVAYLTYDDQYFYIGILCQDPDPSRIRAPYVDRDNVLGDQDNVAVQIDTRNDGRTALELRSNPRGIQGDAFINDASASDSEDFSPDYFYDTAARITRTGWSVEFRIPFSTLRYSSSRTQTWGILIWRNYPREFRYQIGSSRIPRGAGCFQCNEMKLLLRDVPPSRHLIAAPYVTTSEDGTATPAPGFVNAPVKADGGLDVKATFSADNVIDATVNPDFSQVESDVGQLTVNSRFAPLYPEKRPFFLEQIDLFQTPIQAVHTRSITSPQWGARFTGDTGTTTYTMLVTEDRGGGSVIVPGPSESGLAPQDFRSLVTVGRVRRDFGQSFAGLLVTDRQMPGGGFNLVAGPDFQWRHSVRDQLTGQLLVSSTRELNRPDLSATWTGQALSSYAGSLNWGHSSRTIDWGLGYTDVGQGFRADAGFVPQVGYRSGNLDLGYKFYPTGFITAVRPAISASYAAEPGGALVSRTFYPYWNLQGRYASAATIEFHVDDRTRVLGSVFGTRFIRMTLQARPSAFVPLFTLTVRAGQDVDVANLRPGAGGDITGSATMRPTRHLDLTFNGERQWLDVASARLFTAEIARLKATYTFTARSFFRVIGQYETVGRTTALYLAPVAAREGNFSGSALYAYKLNWQTVLFVGYGDDRSLVDARHLTLQGRNVFVKVSYAFQR